jgi:Bacterial PH domain
MNVETIPANIIAFVLIGLLTLIPAVIPMLWMRRDGWRASARKSAISVGLVAPIIMALGYAVSDSALEISGDRLYVRAAVVYEYKAELSEFNLTKARAGSYSSIEEAELGLRLNGISIPGYSAGKFSRAGGGTVFALLTDRSRVLYLPAKAGPSLLVSVDDPESLLTRLHLAAGHVAPAAWQAQVEGLRVGSPLHELASSRRVGQ